MTTPSPAAQSAIESTTYPVEVLVPDTAAEKYDAILSGLALFEAHASNDTEAVRALLSGQTPGTALNSVLFATDLLVEAFSAHSVHTAGDLIGAFRRQVLHDQAAQG
ncbi:hypothetical protein [Nocardioides sp. Leaf285]|uniref:hypothetical protein n=1 Tax=Nocardioides sp. Leaf285 TaxID=1736322 RepID=UPI000702D95D|nr:hypothetical protein [Nocardioides sp. Leaf285]KQP62869.1 hypothetical protein ASF47_17810 [Nocardioides sp. Leaf285]